MTVIDLEPEQNARSHAEAIQSHAEVAQEHEQLQETHIIEAYEAEMSHPEHVCGAHCDHGSHEVIETANELFDDVEVSDHHDHEHHTHDHHDHHNHNGHEHNHGDHGPNCQCPAHKATESAEKFFEAVESEDHHDHEHHTHDHHDHHNHRGKTNENNSSHEHICHAGCEHAVSDANKNAQDLFEAADNEHHTHDHHNHHHSNGSEHDHGDHGPNCQCPAHKATEQANEIFTEQEVQSPQQVIDRIELQNALKRQLEESERNEPSKVGALESVTDSTIKNEATQKSVAPEDDSDQPTDFLADSTESKIREDKPDHFEENSIDAGEIDVTKTEDLAQQQVEESGEIDKTIDLPTQDFASPIEDDIATTGHEGLSDSPPQYLPSLYNSEAEVKAEYSEDQLTEKDLVPVVDNDQANLLRVEEITLEDSAEEVSYIEHDGLLTSVDEAPISGTVQEDDLVPRTDEMLDIAQDNSETSRSVTSAQNGDTIIETFSSNSEKEEIQSSELPTNVVKLIDEVDNPEQKEEIQDELEKLIIFYGEQLEREKGDLYKETSFDANTSQGIANKVELLSRVFGIEQSQLIQVLGLEKNTNGELILSEESIKVLRGLKKRLSMELSHEFPSKAVSSAIGGMSVSTRNLGKLILLILKKKTLIGPFQTV